MQWLLAGAALVLSLVAVGCAAAALRSARGRRPTGVTSEAGGALRHLAVVRYDAFGDMGGRLSWSLALLDEGGNGVVLTSINGRNEARTYAKNVAGWSAEQQLSPEEAEAITHARSR